MAEENNNFRPWLHAVCRLGMTAAAHPVEYVKVLIQIGYEPVPPKPTRTLFGKQALILPGLFEYMGYIRKQEGFFGLYRGFVPRLCGHFMSGYVFTKAAENMEIQYEPDESGDHAVPDEKIREFLLVTSRDMVAQSMAIIASQPFQVVTLRMLAQFIGKETEYSGVFSSVQAIFNNDGISGFFAGLVPRLMAEVLSLWICNSLTFVVNTYLIEDSEFRNYTSAMMSFIASSLTYPFNLISNIMAVNNSGLVAGMPPMMPLYVNWKHCWNHLSHQNQLKRGSSLIWRYYSGPMYGNIGKSIYAGGDMGLLNRKGGLNPTHSSTTMLTDLPVKAPVDPYNIFTYSGSYSEE